MYEMTKCVVDAASVYILPLEYTHSSTAKVVMSSRFIS